MDKAEYERRGKEYAKRVFVHNESDDLSVFSCVPIDKILAKPETVAVLQKLQRVNQSDRYTKEERVKASEKLFAAAKGFTYPVGSINRTHIREFFDDSPVFEDENGSHTFQELTEAELAEIMPSNAGSAGQPTGSWASRPGRLSTRQATTD